MSDSGGRAYPNLRFIHVVAISLLLATAVLAVWLFAVHLPAVSVAERHERMRQLFCLGRAYQRFVLAEGKSPNIADDLEPYLHDDPHTLRALRAKAYVLIWSADFDTPRPRSEYVLGYESRDEGWTLMGDGHVEFLTHAEFETRPKLNSLPEYVPLTPNAP